MSFLLYSMKFKLPPQPQIALVVKLSRLNSMILAPKKNDQSGIHSRGCAPISSLGKTPECQQKPVYDTFVASSAPLLVKALLKTPSTLPPPRRQQLSYPPPLSLISTFLSTSSYAFITTSCTLSWRYPVASTARLKGSSTRSWMSPTEKATRIRAQKKEESHSQSAQ